MKEQSDLVILYFFFFSTMHLGTRSYVFLNDYYMNLLMLPLPACFIMIAVWKDEEEGTLEEKILRALQPLDKIYLILFYLVIFSSLYNVYHYYSIGLYLVFAWYLFQSALFLYAYFKNRPFVESTSD